MKKNLFKSLFTLFLCMSVMVTPFVSMAEGTDDEETVEESQSLYGKVINRFREMDAEVAAGGLAVKRDLSQKDKEVQNALISADEEVAVAAALGYHEWTLDYGIAREIALRPLEFGYFSYHVMLNDPMGDFSTIESGYTTVFGIVSLGLDVAATLPNIINEVNNMTQSLSDYRKTSTAADIQTAKDRKEKAQEAIKSIEEEQQALRNSELMALSDATTARANAEDLAQEAADKDKKAAELFQAELQAAADGNMDLADDYRRQKEEAYADAADARIAAEAALKQAELLEASAAADHDAAVDLEKERQAAQQEFNDASAMQAAAEKKLQELLGMDDTEKDLAGLSGDTTSLKEARDAAADEATRYENMQKQEEQTAKEQQAIADEYAAQAKAYEAIAESAGNSNDKENVYKYKGMADAARESAQEAQKNADSARITAEFYADTAAEERTKAAKLDDMYQSGLDNVQATQEKREQQEAEYAVLTGTATDEQKAMYQQIEQQRAVAKQQAQQRAEDISNSIPTAGGLVKDIENMIPSLAGGVFRLF